MCDFMYCIYTFIFILHCALYVFYEANKDDYYYYKKTTTFKLIKLIKSKKKHAITTEQRDSHETLQSG